MLAIMPIDSRRERSRRHTPPVFFCTGARQMRSRAFCSSPNTVVAPMNSTTTPITVAMMPSLGLLALAIMPSIAFAPCSPIRPASPPVSSPRTASPPKNQPATAITMTSSGAIENSV